MLYTPSISYNVTPSSSPPTSPSIANATYASMLLTHAESLYNAANSTTPFTTFSESVPAVASAYNSSGYEDDLCLAALALALATNQSKYYADAYRYYVEYELSGSSEVWNWDSRTPAVYVLFVEAATARPGLAEGAGLSVNLTGWQNETERYFDSIVDGKLSSPYLTKGKLWDLPFWPRGADGHAESRWPSILGWRFGSGVSESSAGGGDAHVKICADRRIDEDGDLHRELTLIDLTITAVQY